MRELPGVPACCMYSTEATISGETNLFLAFSACFYAVSYKFYRTGLPFILVYKACNWREVFLARTALPQRLGPYQTTKWVVMLICKGIHSCVIIYKSSLELFVTGIKSQSTFYFEESVKRWRWPPNSKYSCINDSKRAWWSLWLLNHCEPSNQQMTLKCLQLESRGFLC